MPSDEAHQLRASSIGSCSMPVDPIGLFGGGVMLWNLIPARLRKHIHPVKRAKKQPASRGFCPRVEALERREVPAAPVINKIQPVAVYLETHGAFSLAYDTQHNLMWYTPGDQFGGTIHSLKPFKSFTAAEIASLPSGTGALAGVKLISTGPNGTGGGAGQMDVAGSTNPPGGANFDTLAYDSKIHQLVLNQGHLVSFDPFTAAHLNDNYAPNAGSGFADGLDVKGNTIWFSPDQGVINKNGVLFASPNNAAQIVHKAQGAVSDQEFGWSGVQDVTTANGHSLFAVAVLNENDQSGKSRTIVRFDPNTGALLGFDPDPNPVAARWEGLGFDGRYLYAADLRGLKVNPSHVEGNIWVFDVGGQGGTVPPPTGEGPTSHPLPMSHTVFFPYRPDFRRPSKHVLAWVIMTNEGANFSGQYTFSFSLPGVVIRPEVATTHVQSIGTTSGKPSITLTGGLKHGQTVSILVDFTYPARLSEDGLRKALVVDAESVELPS
jgi:hypothetical protein